MKKVLSLVLALVMVLCALPMLFTVATAEKSGNYNVNVMTNLPASRETVATIAYASALEAKDKDGNAVTLDKSNIFFTTATNPDASVYCYVEHVFVKVSVPEDGNYNIAVSYHANAGSSRTIAFEIDDGGKMNYTFPVNDLAYVVLNADLTKGDHTLKFFATATESSAAGMLKKNNPIEVFKYSAYDATCVSALPDAETINVIETFSLKDATRVVEAKNANTTALDVTTLGSNLNFNGDYVDHITYKFNVPEAGTYKIALTYAASVVATQRRVVKFAFDTLPAVELTVTQNASNMLLVVAGEFTKGEHTFTLSRSLKIGVEHFEAGGSATGGSYFTPMFKTAVNVTVYQDKTEYYPTEFISLKGVSDYVSVLPATRLERLKGVFSAIATEAKNADGSAKDVAGLTGNIRTHESGVASIKFKFNADEDGTYFVAIPIATPSAATQVRLVDVDVDGIGVQTIKAPVDGSNNYVVLTLDVKAGEHTVTLLHNEKAKASGTPALDIMLKGAIPVVVYRMPQINETFVADVPENARETFVSMARKDAYEYVNGGKYINLNNASGNINLSVAGNYIAYRFEIAEAGTYKIAFKVSSCTVATQVRKLFVQIGDDYENITVPNNANHQYMVITKALDAGVHTLYIKVPQDLGVGGVLPSILKDAPVVVYQDKTPVFVNEKTYAWVQSTEITDLFPSQLIAKLENKDAVDSWNLTATATYAPLTEVCLKGTFNPPRTHFTMKFTAPTAGTYKIAVYVNIAEKAGSARCIKFAFDDQGYEELVNLEQLGYSYITFTIDNVTAGDHTFTLRMPDGADTTQIMVGDVEMGKASLNVINYTVYQPISTEGGFELVDGAAMRIADQSALRFSANYKDSFVQTLKGLYGNDVSFGLVIAKTADVAGLNAFTIAELNLHAVKFDKVISSATKDGDGNYNFSATVEVADNNVSYSAIGFIQLKMQEEYTDGEGKIATRTVTKYIYTDYNAEDNARSVKDVAIKAMTDVKTASEGAYVNAVKLGNDTVYAKVSQDLYYKLAKIYSK